MNSTKTRIETTVVDQRHATSAILFGGAANSHYADERTRQIMTRVRRNVHGEYVAELGTARTIDFAGNATPQLCDVRVVAQSMIFTVIDDAREWACDAAHWALANMTQHFGSEWASFPGGKLTHTYCDSCGRWDTISTTFEAYADVYTCSVCSDSSRRQIGD
jgi:hypothetical protein